MKKTLMIIICTYSIFAYGDCHTSSLNIVHISGEVSESSQVDFANEVQRFRSMFSWYACSDNALNLVYGHKSWGLIYELAHDRVNVLPNGFSVGLHVNRVLVPASNMHEVAHFYFWRNLIPVVPKLETAINLYRELGRLEENLQDLDQSLENYDQLAELNLSRQNILKQSMITSDLNLENYIEKFNSASARYNEFFADLLSVLFYDDLTIVARESALLGAQNSILRSFNPADDEAKRLAVSLLTELNMYDELSPLRSEVGRLITQLNSEREKSNFAELVMAVLKLQIEGEFKGTRNFDFRQTNNEIITAIKNRL